MGSGYTTALRLGIVTEMNFVVDFIRLKLNFIQKKNTKIGVEPPFGGLRGNVSTASIARWRARGQLPVRHN